MTNQKIKLLEQQLEELLKQRPEYRDWFEGIREQINKVPPQDRLALSMELMANQLSELKKATLKLKDLADTAVSIANKLKKEH